MDRKCPSLIDLPSNHDLKNCSNVVVDIINKIQRTEDLCFKTLLSVQHNRLFRAAINLYNLSSINFTFSLSIISTI